MGNKTPSVDRKMSLPYVQSVDNNEVDSSSLVVFTQQLSLLTDINIFRETIKTSTETNDLKEDKESKGQLKYCNDIYHLIRILADRIASPTFNANEYEITVVVFNALMRLYTYPLTAKKTLAPNLASLIRFLDVSNETIFSNTIMVIHVGFRSSLDESFRLNIYIQLEKLGYFSVSLSFLMQHYSNVNMNYCSVLILQDILWILRRQSSFPNTLMLQFKIRHFLRQFSVLMNLFELSRHPVAAVQQMSSLILNALLKSSDKTSCVGIQDLSQSHGAVLWTFYRFVTYLLAFMEQRGSRDISFKISTTTRDISSGGASSTSSEYCPAGTQRLQLIFPQKLQDMLEHHFPLPEEPAELSHCLEVTGQLLMKLCMGNTNNTQLILRAIPEGMSIFLFPQATSSSQTDSNIPESISEYAEKMECWLRWHVLLAALGQRVDSLRVVWNKQALDHLRVQLRMNIIGLDRLRELSYEIWDPMTVDISYPMLDALIPVKGIFLRILLQDLEADHVALQSTATSSTSGCDKSNNNNNNNNVLLLQNEFLEVSLQIVDRALLCSSKLDHGREWMIATAAAVDQQHQILLREQEQEEEEIILLCLRTLLLLHQRWPEETRPGIPIGGLLILLKTSINRCTQLNIISVENRRSYTGTSFIWLQRCLSLLRVRLSGCTRSDWQLMESLGGLQLLLRLLTDRLLLPVLRGAGDNNFDGDEEAMRKEDLRLSNGGSGSMLYTTLKLLLELTVQSSHIASHLCHHANLSLLVKAMAQLGIYSESLSEGKVAMKNSSKAIEMMSDMFRRLLIINPLSIYKHAVSMGLVQGLLLGSFDSKGRGILGQSASELLLDLLALDLQDRVALSISVSEVRKSEESHEGITVISDFLRFLPLQMFRIALCSTPELFRAIYNQESRHYSIPFKDNVNATTTTSTSIADVCCDLVWNETVKSRSRRLVMDSICQTYPYFTELCNVSENDTTAMTPTISSTEIKAPPDSTSSYDPDKQPQVCGIFLRRLLLPDIPLRLKFASPVDIYRLSKLLLSHLVMEVKYQEKLELMSVAEPEVEVEPQLLQEDKKVEADAVSNPHCCCLSIVTLGNRGRDSSGRSWTPTQSLVKQKTTTTIVMKDLGLTCMAQNQSYYLLEDMERDSLLLLGILALQRLPSQLVVSERSHSSLSRLPTKHNPSSVHVEPISMMLESQYVRIAAKLHQYIQIMKICYGNHCTATTTSSTTSCKSVVSVFVDSSPEEILHVMEDMLTRIECESTRKRIENENTVIESTATATTMTTTSTDQRNGGEVANYSSGIIPSSVLSSISQGGIDSHSSNQDNLFTLKTNKMNDVTSSSSSSSTFVASLASMSSSGSGLGVLRAVSCSLLAISQIVTEAALTGVNVTNDNTHYLPSSNSRDSDRSRSSGVPNAKPVDDPMDTIQNDSSYSPILQEVLPLLLQILNICHKNIMSKELGKDEQSLLEINATVKTQGNNSKSTFHPEKKYPSHNHDMTVVMESARTSAVALALLAQLATVVKDWVQRKQREAVVVKSSGSGSGSGVEVLEESLLETMNPKGELLTSLSSKEWIDCLCAYCRSSIAQISPQSTFSALTILQTILLCVYPQSLDIIDKLCEVGFPIRLVDSMVNMVCAPPVAHAKKQPPMLRSSSLYEYDNPKTLNHQFESKPRAMSLRSQSSSSIKSFPTGNTGGANNSALTPKDILKYLQSELAAELGVNVNANTTTTTPPNTAAGDVEEGGAEGSSGHSSSDGMIKHAAAVECVVLLRLMVCHGLHSGGGEIMGFMGEPLPKYLTCFLTTPLLHTLLTDPELGLSILGTVTPIRRPVAIWNADMTAVLRAALSKEMALIHTKNIYHSTSSTTTITATTTTTSMTMSDNLWDMTSSTKRLVNLFPIIGDEVTVEGIYISMLLEPQNEDDIGVRHLPRFVESLQASLATSKKVFEHLKSSPSELRKVGRQDAFLSQLAIKQRVLENILKKHPELGYSNLSVDLED